MSPTVHCVYPAARTGPVFCSSCVCVFQVLASPSVCCQWRVDCCVAFFLSAEQSRLPAGVGLTHFSARTHTNTQTHAALNVHIMIWIVRSFVPSFLEKNWKLRKSFQCSQSVFERQLSHFNVSSENRQSTFIRTALNHNQRCLERLCTMRIKPTEPSRCNSSQENSPVGRNPEQIRNPEGSHLL